MFAVFAQHLHGYTFGALAEAGWQTLVWTDVIVHGQMQHSRASSPRMLDGFPIR